MPTFLSDPPFALYLVFGAFVVIAAAIAASRQDRKSFRTLAIAVALLLIVIIIDMLVQSPRERAVAGAQAMSKAAETNDPAAFVAQLADTIEYNGSQPQKLTKEQIRGGHFWAMLKQYNVTHVAVWDFSRENVREIDENTIEIGFMAKGETPQGQFPLFIRATFAKQPDGQMKLTKFATFHPTNHSEPLAIPGFP